MSYGPNNKQCNMMVMVMLMLMVMMMLVNASCGGNVSFGVNAC